MVTSSIFYDAPWYVRNERFKNNSFGPTVESDENAPIKELMIFQRELFKELGLVQIEKFTHDLKLSIDCKNVYFENQEPQLMT